MSSQFKENAEILIHTNKKKSYLDAYFVKYLANTFLAILPKKQKVMRNRDMIKWNSYCMYVENPNLPYITNWIHYVKILPRKIPLTISKIK